MNHNGIVFIHGAGLGGFIWDEVKSELDFPAFAIDFPNRNQGDKINQHLSFEDYSKAIIKQIKKWKLEKIILVTHSIGGCVGLKVAEYFGERIFGFVGIASAIPSNGNSFLSCLPFPQKFILPLLLNIAGTKPPKSAIETGLCNDLSDRQKKRVVENFTPESKSLYTQKCAAKIPDCERLYIKLIQDKEFLLSMQDKMAVNLKTKNIAALQSGHLPMLSQPKELAKILNGFTKSIL